VPDVVAALPDAGVRISPALDDEIGELRRLLAGLRLQRVGVDSSW